MRKYLTENEDDYEVWGAKVCGNCAGVCGGLCCHREGHRCRDGRNAGCDVNRMLPAASVKDIMAPIMYGYGRAA